jgi:hypothetical protein
MGYCPQQIKANQQGQGAGYTVPYAMLRLPELPSIAPKAANGPPRQMTFQEILFITECCVVFYAVTYFAGKWIYSTFGSREDTAVLSLDGKSIEGYAASKDEGRVFTWKLVKPQAATRKGLSE